MHVTIQQRFGARVVLLRKKSGFSQERLCERTGINERHIRDIEHGDKEVCLINIGKLAEAFGVSIMELMRDV